MKILKKVLIVIAAIVVLLCIGSLFISPKVHIERSLVMKAHAENIFDQVNTIKNYTQWSPWYKMDTAMAIVYDGPSSGLGAAYSWDSKNKNLGKGRLTISESVPYSLVVNDLDFGGEGTAKSGYKLEPSDTGVNVIMYFDSEMSGMIEKYMGLMMKGMMQDVFDQGLNNIKTITESMPPPDKKPVMTVELTTTSDVNYLAVRDTASIPTIGMKLGMAYGIIGEAMKKQGLEMAGPVFAIYYSDSETNWEMDAAAAVNKPGKADGKVKPGMLKAGNAVVAHYFGDYSGLPTAHKAIDEFISSNGKKVIGAPWEVYISDPMMEKDTAKWQTDVFYPVE